jgi:hypothetical protein
MKTNTTDFATTAQNDCDAPVWPTGDGHIWPT